MGREMGETYGKGRPDRESNWRHRLGIIAHVECAQTSNPAGTPQSNPFLLSAKLGGIVSHFYSLWYDPAGESNP